MRSVTAPAQIDASQSEVNDEQHSLSVGPANADLRSRSVSLPSPSPSLSHQTNNLSAGPSRPPAGHILGALESCSRKQMGLTRVRNLRELVAVVESGEIERFRAEHGPKRSDDGSKQLKADPQWSSFSTTVNRRERLYDILATDFSGNKDAFFAFFTTPPTTNSKGKRKSSRLRSLRLISEAIPYMTSDVEEEMRKQDYIDNNTSQFSANLWHARWGTQNHWEVWRALGKERYGTETTEADE